MTLEGVMTCDNAVELEQVLTKLQFLDAVPVVNNLSVMVSYSPHSEDSEEDIARKATRLLDVFESVRVHNIWMRAQQS